MPPNIFALGQDAFKDAYATQQGMRQDRGRVQAGRALAAGDRQGAQAAFGDAGLTEDVRAVQGDQRRDDALSQDQAQTAHGNEQQDQAKKAAFLKDLAQGLKGVPAGQRRQALDQVLPHFQELGIAPDDFASLTEDQLNDQNLDIFAGEVDKHQMVNLGGGGVGDYNQRSGDFRTLREPTQKAPTGFEYAEDGSLHPIQGYIQGRAALSTATRAPPRPRASGGGKSGGIPAPAHSGIDPSQVKWN
jgi:hypothetical protein